MRLANSPNTLVADVLLPEGFPVEAKALKQLANLANVPATHLVDAFVVPVLPLTFTQVMQVLPLVQLWKLWVRLSLALSVLTSIVECACTLLDLTIDEFMSKRDQFVEKMKGDYFFGTRDVTMTAEAMRSLFQYGIPGWLDAMLDTRATGSVIKSDLQQLAARERTHLLRWFNGW